MSSPLPSVLIVDPSADNREVLRTVLARRGITVFEAEAADRGLELATEHQPSVIVLDLEAESRGGEAIREQFLTQSADAKSQVIVLGKVRRGPVFAGGHVIAKPYHFAPLIHTIERLATKTA
jgi:CheY-like chemotaxis protein